MTCVWAFFQAVRWSVLDTFQRLCHAGLFRASLLLVSIPHMVAMSNKRDPRTPFDVRF